MSESVVADFVAKFNSERTPRGQPIRGRVLLSRDRLVLAADDDHRVSIPLHAIEDVGVGQVPPELGDFFDSTVSIAFTRGGEQYVAAIEADDGTIGKFSTVLFKSILNGTAVTVKHPASEGGRVTDEPFRDATLSLRSQSVLFRRPAATVALQLAAVTDFDRARREIEGATRPVLVVHHTTDGRAQTTLAALDSTRKLSILGRYLRLEYAELVRELGDIDLGDDETEVLVAVYSGGGGAGISLASVLDMDAARVTMLLNSLTEQGLLVEGPDGTTLSPKGRVYLNHHMDDIDA